MDVNVKRCGAARQMRRASWRHRMDCLVAGLLREKSRGGGTQELVGDGIGKIHERRRHCVGLGGPHGGEILKSGGAGAANRGQG